MPYGGNDSYRFSSCLSCRGLTPRRPTMWTTHSAASGHPIVRFPPSQGSSLHWLQVPDQTQDDEFVIFIRHYCWRYFANGEILDNSQLIFHEAMPKAAFIDFQCPDFRFECRGRAAETGRRPH